MWKLDQKGFGAIEIIVTVVAVVLIGGAGWYVMSNRDNTPEQNNEQQTSIEENSNGKCSAPSKTANSSKDSFSICVPGGWELTSDTESEAFIVYPPFATDNNEAVVKNEDIGGGDGTGDQFTVFLAEENYQGWTDKNAEKSTFKLNDGTKGTVYYTKHSVSAEGPGPVEGEQDYEYLFEKNGKFIHAVYTILPGTDSKLNDVESVLKTLEIKS